MSYILLILSRDEKENLELVLAVVCSIRTIVFHQCAKMNRTNGVEKLRQKNTCGDHLSFVFKS